MAKHLDLGREGEDIAARYLKKNGYRILGSRVRVGKDEIDLIAYDRKEKMYAFIEVKTRTNVSDAYPTFLAVNRRKQKCLRRAIAGWCMKNDMDEAARLDIICVDKDEVGLHLKGLGDPFSHS